MNSLTLALGVGVNCVTRNFNAIGWSQLGSSDKADKSTYDRCCTVDEINLHIVYCIVHARGVNWPHCKN